MRGIGGRNWIVALVMAATAVPGTAQTVRAGLWEEQVLQGGAPMPELPEDVWRTLSEDARRNGRRLARAGQHAQVCWVEHKLRDFDEQIQSSLPGAAISYSDVSADAFTTTIAWKVDATISGTTVTRYKWLAADCGDLVAQSPYKPPSVAQADPQPAAAPAAAAHGATVPPAAAPAAAPSQTATHNIDSAEAWQQADSAAQRQDWSLMLTLMQQLAQTGDRNALFNLGQMHRQGHGVAENLTEAVRWYHKAAEAGHAEAQLGVGMAYLQGVGVEKNPQLGRQWLEKAAAQNVPRAREVLAGGVQAATTAQTQPGAARSEAEQALQRAEAEYKRRRAEQDAINATLDRLSDRIVELANRAVEGRPVSLSELERSQHGVERLEAQRKQASQQTEVARRRMLELREHARRTAAQTRPVQRSMQTAALPAKSAPATTTRTPAPTPAKTTQTTDEQAASGKSGKLYYTAGVIYEKRGNTMCSDSRLVVSGPLRSSKNEGGLSGEIRTRLRREYPHSVNNSYLVAVVPEGQAMIVYQVERSLASQPCKDKHIEVARGKTMAEAESKIAKLPRATRFVREIQRWPQGLER